MSRAHRIAKPCTQWLDSAYAQEVLSDTPVAYWPYQECHRYPQDRSGNGFHVTSVTGADTGKQYRQPGALSDLNDRSILQIGGSIFFSPLVSTAVNNVTIEMLLNIDTITLQPQAIFYNGNGGANGYGILITGAMKMQVLKGGIALGTPSTTSLSLDTWYHVAVTFANPTWTYYLDGAADGTYVSAGAPNTPTGSTQTGDNSIQRYHEHIALYETALSAATIAAHYAAI